MEYIKKKNHLMQRCSKFLFFIIFWSVFPFVNATDIASSSLPESNNTNDANTNELLVSDIETKPVNQDLSPPVILISKPAVLPDDENNIRLLELSVGSYKFDELIMVYQHEDILFVPFGALSELIDLAIKADPSSGTAKGYIFNEKKTFFLDIKRSEVTLSGVMKQFDNKRTAARILDDVYVDSDLLSEWLPFKINIDLYASRLNINRIDVAFSVKKRTRESYENDSWKADIKRQGIPKVFPAISAVGLSAH